MTGGLEEKIIVHVKSSRPGKEWAINRISLWLKQKIRVLRPNQSVGPEGSAVLRWIWSVSSGRMTRADLPFQSSITIARQEDKTGNDGLRIRWQCHAAPMWTAVPLKSIYSVMYQLHVSLRIQQMNSTLVWLWCWILQMCTESAYVMCYGVNRMRYRYVPNSYPVSS